MFIAQTVGRTAVYSPLVTGVGLCPGDKVVVSCGSSSSGCPNFNLRTKLALTTSNIAPLTVRRPLPLLRVHSSSAFYLNAAFTADASDTGKSIFLAVTCIGSAGQSCGGFSVDVALSAGAPGCSPPPPPPSPAPPPYNTPPYVASVLVPGRTLVPATTAAAADRSPPPPPLSVAFGTSPPSPSPPPPDRNLAGWQTFITQGSDAVFSDVAVAHPPPAPPPSPPPTPPPLTDQLSCTLQSSLCELCAGSFNVAWCTCSCPFSVQESIAIAFFVETLVLVNLL